MAAPRILGALALASLVGACTVVGDDGSLTNINPLFISHKSTAQITEDLAATTHHGTTGLQVLHTDQRNDIELIRMHGTPPPGFGEASVGDRLLVQNVPVTVKHASFGRCIDAYDPTLDAGNNFCTKRGLGFVYGFTSDRGPDSEIGPGYSGSGAYNAAGELVGVAVALVTQPDSDALLVFYVPIRDVLTMVQVAAR